MVLQEKVLVLNKGFHIIGIITVQDAIKMIFKETAVVMNDKYESFTLQEWQDHPKNPIVLRSPQIQFNVPEIVRVLDFNKVLNLPIQLTNANVFLRDNYMCQYCGEKPPRNKLTIDHIIPKSRAAEFNFKGNEINCWTNVVTSCIICNNHKKDNKTLEEANMTLLNKPQEAPTTMLAISQDKIKASWKSYIKQ